MKKYFGFLVFIGALGTAGQAQPTPKNTVSGAIVDKASQRPVEYAAVVLEKSADNSVVQKVMSDNHGRFTLDNIPMGEYKLRYGPVGGESRETAPFAVKPQQPLVDLGQLEASAPVLVMEKMDVTATQSKFLNSIDRKVYNVGKDIQAATGSATDLLENIPSVQVDPDGNVSLRGSADVLVLVNGRTSNLTQGTSRGDVLQRMSGDMIDRIEVITNPSAKYDPNGTAGIINIVLKEGKRKGFSSTVTANIGNDSRYITGASFSYDGGKFSTFLNLNLRQDYRPRETRDFRTVVDPVTGVTTSLEQITREQARPWTQFIDAGFEYIFDPHNNLQIKGSESYRYLYRHSVESNVFRDAAGNVTSEYNRVRVTRGLGTLPPTDESLETRDFSAIFQHTFAKKDHALNLLFKSSTKGELENNHYENEFTVPVAQTTFDSEFVEQSDRMKETALEYALPVGNTAKFEAGYSWTSDRVDEEFTHATPDPLTGDLLTSNRFIMNQTIHAFYLTYAATLGKVSFLAGLRPEIVTIRSHLITTGETVPNDYDKVYPSLHLAYAASENHELQLNYSHRVNRPTAEMLNPFPELFDPHTLREGNPRLLPEEAHSIEAGYQYKHNEFTFLGSLFYRYVYNSFTDLTYNVGDNTLVNTKANLGSNHSAGVEIVGNTSFSLFGLPTTLDVSSDIFTDTIDASNLGYHGSRSVLAWNLKGNVNIQASKKTFVQFNTDYNSALPIPQGTRRPTFACNLGIRHEIIPKQLVAVLTVSDLFNSLRDGRTLNAPGLIEDISRRRSTRIIFLGLSYSFGTETKKPKNTPLNYDIKI